MRTYSELITLPTFAERLEYLKTHNGIGIQTFGTERWLNQHFYTSHEWRSARDFAIVRDMGCDLAIPELPIVGTICVHHLEAITVEDVVNGNPKILDPENLVCCSYNTHQLITYARSLTEADYGVMRQPYDTCPWRTN